MTELRSIELDFLGGPSRPGPSSTAAADAEDAGVDVHQQEIRDLAEMLEHHYRGEPRIHVGSGIAIYHEEGNPAACVTPDLVVLQSDARSLPGHFKTWESGPSPRAVIDVSCEATREDDLGIKRDVYARFGVAEVFLYDPLGECLDPPFRGYRLEGRRYRLLPPESDGSVVSALGLSFRAEGGRLTVLDTASGKALMHTAEAFDELERLRTDVVRMLGE